MSSNSSRGAFIVIEGLDRSGKSTQAQALYQHLQDRLGASNVKLIKFPDRTTPIGKMIDSYLRSESELDDRAIHLLFSANRWEAASSIIKDLESGVTLICDRYAFSGLSFTFSKNKPGLTYEWCLSPDIGLPSPDIVLFLDISPEKAKLRGGYGEERYEKEEMQKRVRDAFKRIGEEYGGVESSWVEIDAGRDLNAVTTDVQKAVEGVIGNRTEGLKDLWSHYTLRAS
ncbi:Thymidylate kinase [Tulasnella sp. 419]|nr:Thymidylate kinase [Tulasnella sp. 419]